MAFRSRTVAYHLRRFYSPSVHQFSALHFSNSVPFPTTPNQQTHYRKQISLAGLFQRYGFQSSQIQTFLARNNFLFNLDLSELEQSLRVLLLSLKLHHNLLVSLVNGCPAVLDLDFLKKWEVGIVLLGQLASSPQVIRSVLEFSSKFRIDPDRFCTSFRILKGLGFSHGTINRVFEAFPGIVMIDENELQKRTDFWILQGFDKEAIDKIYHSFPGVLGFQVENRLKPLINEFLEMGFGRCLVRQEIVRELRILCMELGEFRRCLELLRWLRCRESIKQKIFSDGELRAGFAVKLRVDCLCKYGLIRRDALNILKREPRLIMYEIEDIERKMDFLLERMKLDVGCLIEVPEYLGVNFDKQIVPRYSVIEYLKSREGLGFKVGLRDIIKPSRLRFYNFYVKPYPECQQIYDRISDNVEKKSGHPVGLWKQFKPPKLPKSREDMKHLKLFSE